MSMGVNTRRSEGIIVLDLSGKITMGEGTLLLRDTLKRFISDGDKKFLLNLGNVSYVDSAGLGELVSSFTTVRNAGGDLKLLNLTNRIQDLLQITKLITVFDVYNDERTALGSFKK